MVEPAGNTSVEASNTSRTTASNRDALNEFDSEIEKAGGARRGEVPPHSSLTTVERKKVRELKRELRRVKLERDILAKATARPPLARRCPARESGSIPGGGSGS